MFSKPSLGILLNILTLAARSPERGHQIERLNLRARTIGKSLVGPSLSSPSLLQAALTRELILCVSKTAEPATAGVYQQLADWEQKICGPLPQPFN